LEFQLEVKIPLVWIFTTNASDNQDDNQQLLLTSGIQKSYKPSLSTGMSEVLKL